MAPPRRPLTRSGMLNQFAGGAVSTATGFAVGSVIAPTLAPLTQELLNETWQLFPSRPLSAGNAAEASIRGALDDHDAQIEAEKTGFNAERFKVLQKLAGDPPGAQQLLEMLNRGFIDGDTLELGLRQSRLRPEWYDSFTKLRHVLPSVSDLIRWGVREVFSPDSRRSLDLDAEFPEGLQARLSEQGYSAEDSRNAWAAHWELPSRTEGADMWHRGLLSDAQYDGLLKALDYAPTWRDKLREVSNAIPGLSDMVRFAVREVYDPAKRRELGLDAEYPEAFTAQARKHGLSEEDARSFWAAHWQLPSATQGYHMLWRGEINEAQLDELLKALDYPTLWRDRLANIAHLVPGRVDLRRMLAAEIIDRAEVKQGYIRLGYTDTDAETLTRFAEQQAASGPTVHQKWADRARSSLFTVTHNEYLDESLDKAGAESSLDVVGVPDAERAAIFAAWDREAAISRLELTPAQIKKAYKKALYTETQALDALRSRGMSAEDANVFLQE